MFPFFCSDKVTLFFSNYQILREKSSVTDFVTLKFGGIKDFI